MAKRCAIHQDAYGSDYICKACREDPANVDWVESSGRKGEREVSIESYRDTDAPAVFDGARPIRDWTETERSVALGLLMGKHVNELAALLQISTTLVRRIRDRFFDGKDVDVTKPDFSWMTEDSQNIIAALSEGALTDTQIANALDVDIAHVRRMRIFFEKTQQRIPHTGQAE